MVQKQTLLKIADNSGAKTVKCIQNLSSKRKAGKIGDIFVISVQKTRDNQKILKLKKKDIFKGVILRTKSFFRKKNGFNIKFEANSMALFDKQNNPLGSRVVGFLPKELKKKFNKFVNFSQYLL